MKAALLFAAGLFFLVSGLGTGAPTKGPYSLGQWRIGARGSREVVETFRGGQRACVIVEGDHKPVVDLKVEVFDKAGNLVARDEGGDFVSAIWYPPRDAEYRIQIHNSGEEYNDCYVVLK